MRYVRGNRTYSAAMRPAVSLVIMASRHPCLIATTEDPALKIETTTVNGVFIEKAAAETGPDAPPIVFVHGGGHGSWMWEQYLGHFAATGRDCYSFSWFGHRGSRELPVDQYVTRSMADVVEELELVAAHVGQAPVAASRTAALREIVGSLPRRLRGTGCPSP
jgi:alpha-beta hydrolase superfamily lysophospholipase